MPQPTSSRARAIVHTHGTEGPVKFSQRDVENLADIGRYRRSRGQPLPFVSYVSNGGGDVWRMTVDGYGKLSEPVFVGNAWHPVDRERGEDG